jgi:hypothetical protein
MSSDSAGILALLAVLVVLFAVAASLAVRQARRRAG